MSREDAQVPEPCSVQPLGQRSGEPPAGPSSQDPRVHARGDRRNPVLRQGRSPAGRRSPRRRSRSPVQTPGMSERRAGRDVNSGGLARGRDRTPRRTPRQRSPSRPRRRSATGSPEACQDQEDSILCHRQRPQRVSPQRGRSPCWRGSPGRRPCSPSLPPGGIRDRHHGTAATAAAAEWPSGARGRKSARTRSRESSHGGQRGQKQERQWGLGQDLTPPRIKDGLRGGRGG